MENFLHFLFFKFPLRIHHLKNLLWTSYFCAFFFFLRKQASNNNKTEQDQIKYLFGIGINYIGYRQSMPVFSYKCQMRRSQWQKRRSQFGSQVSDMIKSSIISKCCARNHCCQMNSCCGWELGIPATTDHDVDRTRSGCFCCVHAPLAQGPGMPVNQGSYSVYWSH